MVVEVLEDPSEGIEVQIDEITNPTQTVIARAGGDGPIVGGITLKAVDIRQTFPGPERLYATRDDGLKIYHYAVTSYGIQSDIDLVIDSPADARFADNSRRLRVRSAHLYYDAEYHYLVTTRSGQAPAVHVEYTPPGQPLLEIYPQPGELTLDCFLPPTNACSNNIPPTVTAPSDIRQVYNLGYTIGLTHSGRATASDDQGDPLLTFTDQTIGDGLIERIWTATDTCGATHEASQLIATGPDRLYVSDNNGQNFVTLPCRENILPPDFRYYDECPGEPTLAVEHSFRSGIQQFVNFRLQNACGQSKSIFVTYTEIDNIPPTIVAPPDITVPCGAPTTTNATGVATASDDHPCGSEASVRFEDEILDPGCPGIIRRSWIAIDTAGNEAVAHQHIHIEAHPGFLLTPPPGLDLSGCADTDLSTNITGAALVQSDCADGIASLTFQDTVHTSACSRSIRRVWQASDHCGRSDEAWQIITVTDDEPPVITAPPNITLDAGSATDPSVTGEATAIDNCGDVTLAFTDLFVPQGCNSFILRTWTATDGCGFTSQAEQNITITDTTPPVLQIPPDIIVRCRRGYAFSQETGTAIATDNVTPHPSITFTETTTGTGCPRTVLRNWIAVDDCGNTSSGVQTIIFSDNLGARFFAPPDVTVDSFDDIDPSVTGEPSLVSSCNQPATITFTDAPPSGNCPQVIVRTWRAADPCSGVSTVTQRLSLFDTVPPVIVAPPDTEVDCVGTDPANPAITGVPTTTDNTPGAVTVTFTDELHGTGCPRIITRTWVAQDACGNQSRAEQIIRVSNGNGIVLVPPPDAETPCLPAPSPVQLGMPEIQSECVEQTVLHLYRCRRND